MEGKKKDVREANETMVQKRGKGKKKRHEDEENSKLRREER
jgi:hypothetical protein